MPGGVSAQGGLPKGVCLSRVVCLPGGGCSPPMDRMTDACENITFSQLLLRTVKTRCVFVWY